MPRAFIPCRQATTALAAREETNLVILAQHGRRDALDRLLEIHLPCLKRAARNYYCPDLDPEDLFQEACFYFCARAIATYPIGLSARLWNWAYPVLPRVLRDACVKWTRIPDEVRRGRAAVLHAQEELRQLLQHEPTTHEIAEWADVKEALVEAVLDGGRTVSLAGGEEEEEEGAGIEPAAPSPAAGRLALIDICQVIFESLGDPPAMRFIVLWVLREYGGCEWQSILTILGDDTGDAPVWATALVDLPLPGAVHLPWAQIRRLFSVPPPRLTNNNLRNWYARQLACVSSAVGLQWW